MAPDSKAGDDARRWRALSLNLLCAACCSALLLPLWVGVQTGYLPAKFDGGKVILRSEIASGRSEIVSGGTRVWMALVVGALTQYGQSLCAYLFVRA